jgi:hypothetical protein
MKSVFLPLVAVLAGFAVAAPDLRAGETPEPAAAPSAEAAAEAPPLPYLPPEGSLVVNLPSDRTIGRGLLQFLVTHRFRDPVRGSDSHTLYSLDSGADFGLGFSWSPLEHAEISLYRSGIQDDYELAAKLALNKSDDVDRVFGAALRFGGDLRRDPLLVTQTGALLPDAKARSAFFAQAILTLHLWNDRIEVSAVPTYASRTFSERRVFNVPVHAAVALSRGWNLQGEYAPPRSGHDGSIAQWTVGIEKVLFRHRFTLVVSNTTRSTVDQYLSGDFAVDRIRLQRQFETGFRNNDWHIGFNLIRQFKIGGL